MTGSMLAQHVGEAAFEELKIARSCTGMSRCILWGRAAHRDGGVVDVLVVLARLEVGQRRAARRRVWHHLRRENQPTRQRCA